MVTFVSMVPARPDVYCFVVSIGFCLEKRYTGLRGQIEFLYIA
jgi:hypothetical protein